jgi:hypothetical protein
MTLAVSGMGQESDTETANQASMTSETKECPYCGETLRRRCESP